MFGLAVMPFGYSARTKNRADDGKTPTSAIPTGLRLPAQGCEATSCSRSETLCLLFCFPLGPSAQRFQPQRGCVTIAPPSRNPFRVVDLRPWSVPEKYWRGPPACDE